ncbi:hypothetical protein HanRHA438_Chr11g0501231 [Helianthus annuus]|nr:hypothetical protein HanIR_Chr11g0525761 [Helianthus annuus]KAJ0870503.1 hypothetical protein HanRHA438_Chr11g0501231 [Helianthus annuus]
MALKYLQVFCRVPSYSSALHIKFHRLFTDFLYMSVNDGIIVQDLCFLNLDLF